MVSKKVSSRKPKNSNRNASRKKYSNVRCPPGCVKRKKSRKKSRESSRKKRRKSRKRKAAAKIKNVKSTIAYCFLMYDTVEHPQVWERFFKDSNGTAEIYSHIKKVIAKTPVWLRKGRARTVKTQWCGEGLVFSFCSMLKKALKKKTNTHFAILSGSCIPLYDYATTYKKIMSTDRASINFWSDPKQKKYGLKFASQWVILNRETAIAMVRLIDKSDTTAQAFLHRMEDIQVENTRKNVMMHCPDETYPINWLIELYGKNVSKHVLKRNTTYTLWEGDNDSPTKFNGPKAKRYHSEICKSKSIFARKFNKAAANLIGSGC